MKYRPAFRLTILSPLGKAPEMRKHQFRAQCHQSIAQIVLHGSKQMDIGTIHGTGGRAGIRRPQLNETTFTRKKILCIVDLGKEPERNGKQENCNSCHSLKG